MVVRSCVFISWMPNILLIFSLTTSISNNLYLYVRVLIKMASKSYLRFASNTLVLQCHLFSSQEILVWIFQNQKLVSY